MRRRPCTTSERSVLGQFLRRPNEPAPGECAHGGRVILDLWNQEFFAAHQGERDLDTSRGRVRQTKRLKGDRLFVQLDYPDGAQEEFEWQLFTPTKMNALAQSVGLNLLFACTDCDPKIAPSPANPRRRTRPSWRGALLRIIVDLDLRGRVFLATHLFVVVYEKPTLRRTFGSEYEAYCDRVKRWWPKRSGN